MGTTHYHQGAVILNVLRYIFSQQGVTPTHMWTHKWVIWALPVMKRLQVCQSIGVRLTIHARDFPQIAYLFVILHDKTIKALSAERALEHFKRATGQGIKMLLQMSQLPLPVAALNSVSAIHALLSDSPSQLLVRESVKVCLEAERTAAAPAIFLFLDGLDATAAETESTAVEQVRVTKNTEAHWTLALKVSRERIHEGAVISWYHRHFTSYGHAHKVNKPASALLLASQPFS